MKSPPIDIILPFHGKEEHTLRCLENIVRTVQNTDHRIILVDDASPNSTLIQTAKISNKRIKPVRLNTHSGFAAAVNAGFRESTSQHLVVIHSDCQPSRMNWLTSLQKSLVGLKDRGVKLVSSRFDNPGTSNEYDERMFGPPVADMDDFVLDKPAPLICSLMHRELFQRIGGGLREYPVAWLEDYELFYRMRHYGFRQGVSAGSYVSHEGGVTVKAAYRNVKLKKLMENNQSLFREDVRKFLR